MKLLDVIDYVSPEVTGLAEPTEPFRVHRVAVRAVASDDQGRVHLLAVAAEGGYLKLPGGGVEAGEDHPAALKRELLEELGYNIEIGEPVGRILQYNQKEGYLQESFCYLGRIIGGSGQPDFTEEEIADGYNPVTYPNLEAAIAAVEALRAAGPSVAAINRRELALLRAARPS